MSRRLCARLRARDHWLAEVAFRDRGRDALRLAAGAAPEQIRIIGNDRALSSDGLRYALARLRWGSGAGGYR